MFFIQIFPVKQLWQKDTKLLTKIFEIFKNECRTRNVES